MKVSGVLPILSGQLLEVQIGVDDEYGPNTLYTKVIFVAVLYHVEKRTSHILIWNEQSGGKFLLVNFTKENILQFTLNGYSMERENDILQLLIKLEKPFLKEEPLFPILQFFESYKNFKDAIGLRKKKRKASSKDAAPSTKKAKLVEVIPPVADKRLRPPATPAASSSVSSDSSAVVAAKSRAGAGRRDGTSAVAGNTAASSGAGSTSAVAVSENQRFMGDIINQGTYFFCLM